MDSRSESSGAVPTDERGEPGDSRDAIGTAVAMRMKLGVRITTRGVDSIAGAAGRLVHREAALVSWEITCGGAGVYISPRIEFAFLPCVCRKWIQDILRTD